jgi:hypothetical protein
MHVLKLCYETVRSVCISFFFTMGSVCISVVCCVRLPCTATSCGIAVKITRQHAPEMLPCTAIQKWHAAN